MGPALLEYNLTEPVIHQLRRLQWDRQRILREAQQRQDFDLALQAIGPARHNLALMSRLTENGKVRSRKSGPKS
jgi:hypothetical protein